MKKIVLFVSVLLLLFPFSGNASHNYAAWIEVDYNGNHIYTFRLITLTDPAPAGVDRCFADLLVWDENGNKVASLLDIPRKNGTTGTDPVFPGLSCGPSATNGKYTVLVPTGAPATPIGNSTTKRNVYEVQYTIINPGKFTVSYEDNAWFGGIVNYQNSGSSTLRVESTFLHGPSVLSNANPRPTNDTTLIVCPGQPYIYSPQWVDSDGDSLSFLATPIVNAVGFTYPDFLGGGNFYVDQNLGTVYWLNSSQLGLYGCGIRVEEFRNGSWIGSMIFQFTLLTQPSNCTVNLIERSNKNPVIYPNPSHGQIQIQGLELAKTNFKIIDNLDRVLFQGQLSFDRTSLDLSQLRPGIYHLFLEGKGSQKLVIR